MSESTNILESANRPALPLPTAAALDGVHAAQFCGLGESTWRELQAQGRIPEPVMFGRAKRWLVRELQVWLEHGAPPLQQWQRLRAKALGLED